MLIANLGAFQNDANGHEEPRVVVQSEDHPERILLETRIVKEDLFQKQQGGLRSKIGRKPCWLTMVNRNPDSMDGTFN